MVGDDLVAEALFLEGIGIVAQQCPHPLVDGREEVRVVVGGHLLEDARQAFEAHTGIDALERQRDAAFGTLIELHEDEIPDLQPTRTRIGVIGDALGALREMDASIEEDLAAWAAGTCLGHTPEVAVVAGVDIAPPRHPLWRDTDLIPPDGPGLLIVPVGGHAEPVGRDAEVLSQQLPGPMDGFALEVVAEAPVAQHLEERMRTGLPADLLEIVVLARHAQAALRVHGSLVRACLDAAQHILELHHAAVGEEQRLVPGGHEAGAGHHRVAPRSEEVQEALADLGSWQGLDPGVALDRSG